MELADIFFPLLVALICSLALGVPALWLARHLKLIDIPGSSPHKQHAHPTPLAGGVVLLGSSLLLILLFRDMLTKEIAGVFLGSCVILAFGFWDDAKGLPASIKLIGQAAATTIVVYAGVRVQIVSSLGLALPPVLANGLNLFITYFWLIGITNALNLIDSMDGLVSGLSSLTFTFFIGAAVASQQPRLATWAAIFAGISVGLYFYNGYPAHFFLGDAGAQTIGFILAAMAVLYNPLDLQQASSWFLPILLLAVPIFDTSLVVYSRCRRGVEFYKGHRDHSYHRLALLGMDPGRAVLALHVGALALDCIAFTALSLPPWQANLIFGACLLLGILLILVLDHHPRFSSLD